MAKIRNVPFPRPCGATGNDAQKLHAPAFAHFRGTVLRHEVFCPFSAEHTANQAVGFSTKSAAFFVPKNFFEIFSLRGLKTDRLYAVPRYDNAQCSDCGGQCDYSRTGTVSPRKRYDAAFIDDCQGEEAHQSEPDDRRYPAHACRRQNQSCQKYGTANFRSTTSPSATKRKRRNHKGYTVSENLLT